MGVVVSRGEVDGALEAAAEAWAVSTQLRSVAFPGDNKPAAQPPGPP